MSALQNAGIFLLHTIFDTYALILLLRVLLQYLRVDYYNPICQFIVKATNPPVIPLRRIIPGYWGLDLATMTVLFFTLLLKTILVALISTLHAPTLSGVLLWTLGEFASLSIKLFFWAILLQVLLQWVQPLSNSPLTALLYQLTAPLMNPVRKRLRRLFSSMGGIDLSPIPVLLGLQLCDLLFAQPLTHIGLQLAIR
jgi:YggT family protein